MSFFKPYSYIFVLTVCLFVCCVGKAQSLQAPPGRYYVEHFGEEDGLPQNSVNSILPDNNDFLWIATEGGIVRFNGNRFLTLPAVTGIYRNNLTRIRSFYYKRKDTIMAYSAANNLVAFIVNNKIVGTEKAIFNKHGMLFVNTYMPFLLPGYFKNPEAGAISDKWDITKGGFFGMPGSKDTFMVLVKNGIAVYDSKGPVGEIIFNKNRVTNILLLDGEAIYIDDENYLNQYSAAGFKKRGLFPVSSKNRLAIFNNRFANNFFCVADSALYIVDISTGNILVKKILTNLQRPDDIHVLYQKDSNTIVIGTQHNGLYVYKKQFFLTTDPPPNGEPDGFYGQILLPDNRTILAGMDKLYRDSRYIGKTKTLLLTGIYSSLKDSKGYYWYVYFDHIMRAREIGIAADTMINLEGTPQVLFEDRQGRVWISSGATFGYFSNNVFTALKFNAVNTAQISCMRQDTKGRYWIGTREGLFILNNIHDTAITEQPSFRSLDIRFIWPEANGQVWVCTYGQGFYLITKDMAIGFPESNGRLAYAHAIIEDAKGYFWIPTNNGLFVTSRESLMAYVKNRNEIPFYYQFSKKHGLRTNEFNGGGQPPYLRWPNGDISLASMQGLVSFNPGNINFNFSKSPILVDNIEADSTEILKREEFDIASNAGNISFSLSGSFWGEKENDLLEYKVLDKEKSMADGSWLPVDASGRINLFSPSHGNYQLIIRKRTGLKANDYLYKTINFTVLPKWYQTKAFFLAAFISLLLVMSGISYWRRRSYRRANRILKEKVNAATAELQQMNSTLEKRVEERTFAIQQAEIKFRTLVEASLVGVYIVQEGKFIYVNPRFEQIFGYGKDELTGTGISQFIPSDQYERTDEKIKVRMSGEADSIHYEIKALKKDGAYAQLEIFGRRTVYEGKPTIIGTLLDITERKKIENELREADLKFRDLVEKSLVGVYIIQDGKFAYVNPRFAEIFGYSQQELINADSVGIVIYEPDRETVSNNIKERISGAADGIRYEARGIKKEGAVVHIEMFGRTTQFEGRPAIIGTLIDITEKKIAEELLIKEKDLSQSIINSLPGVFYVFDQHGEYQLWNKNHETLTGYTAGEMSKIHPEKFIEKDKVGLMHKRIEKVFTEGHAELEANFIRKDGTGMPYYFNGTPITYNDKPCVMGVGIDISEQKKAEEQLIIEKDLSQSIINSLPGIFFIFDQSRTHLLWNRNYETVTGYNSEELKGKLAGTCVEEKDLALFTKAVEEMYSAGNAELEVTMITKAKKRIPFYLNGLAITYDGKSCILGIGIDISERKIAEREREHANYLLNERIKELTTLYRAGLVLQREEKSVFVTLHDFVSLLPAGWQYPGITAACIKLGEMEFITSNFVPGPYSQHSTFTTSYGATGKIEIVYLEEMPQEDEGPFLAEERKLIDMLADMLRIYFARREAIEALQKSEANLHTIFDNTDTVYALLNANFQVIAYNQRAADFSKKELKKGFTVHDNIIDYFPGNLQADVAENLKKAMKGNSISYEINYPQPDGKLNWYYVRMFPIKNVGHEIFGAMLAVSDITEKKLLEQEILDQKVQEQKTMIRAILIGEERERNKIGQELHDNVNQILAGTKLYLSMARKAKSGGVDIINESMELIDSAIEEIRSLSKEKVTPLKKINLEDLLQTLLHSLDDTSIVKTSFTYTGSQQPVEDELKLNIYRIIQEQLNNILKHANAKNISVEVEAGIKNIRVWVTDDGKGFDPAAKKKGIGISNMINRVESFNGTITINSNPGKGCRLEVNLPCFGEDCQEMIL